MYLRLLQPILLLKDYFLNKTFSKSWASEQNLLSTTYDYIQEKRIMRKLKRQINYAKEGIVSFSTKPLKLATILGGMISIVSFIYFIEILLQTLISGKDIPGYASMMSCLLFCTGMIMIMLGVIGEYVGRIYISINNAPQYVIRNKIKDGKDLENNGE